jgi:hypothetical protein
LHGWGQRWGVDKTTGASRGGAGTAGLEKMANWALLLCTTGFLGSLPGDLVKLRLSMDNFLVVILALVTVLLTMVSGEWLCGLDEKQKWVKRKHVNWNVRTRKHWI